MALATRLVEEVGPRVATGPAGLAAQRWVEIELLARGWDPVVLREEHGGGYVYACRPGASKQTALFLAHTDTVAEDVVGANDNAASVGVLLVAAEHVADSPRRTVCFAFPNGEELGMLGSRSLAARWLSGEAAGVGPLDQVMSLDLVGRGQLIHNGLGPAWDARRLRALLDMAPITVPWVYRAVSEGWVHMERSDHAPFGRRGIPASHLLARAEAGVDLAYHTPADTLDRLDPEVLSQAIDVVIGVASAPPLPEAGRVSPAFVIPGTTTVVPGIWTWFGLIAGMVAAGAGALGAVKWRIEVRGWASLLGGVALGAVVSWLAMVGASRGRPFDGTLADPVVIAGWCAWLAVFLVWPFRAPAPTGRRVGILAASVLTGVALTVGLPLIAMPLALVAGVVGLSGIRGAWGPALAVTLVPALYLVRPDAVRELDFHFLLPASEVVWAAALTALTLPAWGVMQGRTMPRGRGVLVASAALAIATLVVIGWGWSLAPYEPPYDLIGSR
jgi:hypothetical protein